MSEVDWAMFLLNFKCLFGAAPDVDCHEVLLAKLASLSIFFLNIDIKIIFKILNPHLRIIFIDFREREKKRERGKNDMREKYWSFSSHTHPNWEANPQPNHVP